VSILRRTASHLDDAAFAELWANALATGQQPARHPHLDDCAECRIRFGSFSQWMTDVRDDAVGEADEVLSPDRLAAQQAVILRRIEAAERPARVIAFPTHSDSPLRRTPVHRWIAAAAAAGLIAGIGLGQIVNLRRPLSPSVFTQPTAPQRPIQTHATAVPAGIALSDEVSLAELEEVATPRYEALRAYDAFTPRAADFVQPR
jgi:hypothetical protein